MTAPDHMLKDANDTCMKGGIHTWSLRQTRSGSGGLRDGHHRARELARFGHEVRLMPPAYVKPYVKRNKNDTADAEAICEAVMRPTMRFVAHGRGPKACREDIRH
jgi:hypothetical protein